MDFGLALTFQFKENNGLQKLLIAAMLQLVPVIGWLIVFGWSLGITRRVIEKQDGLPEFDMANDLVRGTKAFLINLVYNIPALVAVIPAGMILGVALAASNSSNVAGVFLLALLCLISIGVVYGLTMMLVVPAAYGNFLAHSEDLIEGLQFGRTLKLVRSAPGAFFLVVVGQFLSTFIGFFGLVACVIGIIFSSVYTTTIVAHLFGQAYVEATRDELIMTGAEQS